VELVEAALAGDRHAIARLITAIENNSDNARTALADLFPYTGQAYIIGVTGAPGTGKSTLVNELTKFYRADGRRVGIVAVDATSPFSGGAILGDRVRMCDLVADSHVFVRSMASRGHLGGLAWTTADVVKVLDAARFDTIIVETVGTGQLEVEIAQMAHTVVVVEMPGMGDEIQSIKAGILEIADIFAVNKSDHDGADRTVAILENMLSVGSSCPPLRIIHHTYLAAVLRQSGIFPPNPFVRSGSTQGNAGWHPTIVKTVAVRGEGVPELARSISSHRRYLEASNELEQRNQARLVGEVERVLRHHMMERLVRQIDQSQLADVLARVVARRVDPHTAAEQLMNSSS
jgi:LAO/AO transport system kinase